MSSSVHAASPLRKSLLPAADHPSKANVDNSEAPSDAPEHSLSSTPVLSRWAVFKFVMLTPMDCGLLMSLFWLLLGIGSSVGVGLALAFTQEKVGELNLILKNKDVPQLNNLLLIISIMIAAMTVLQSISTFGMKKIGLLKRIHLNRTLHAHYFTDKKFYLLNAFHSSHCDSIDSRLTSDIDTMTSELYGILQVLVLSLTNFIFGLTLLGNSTLAMIGLACLILFSLLMFGLVQFFSKLTSSRVSDLKRDEGYFSFQHTRIKKNCESIAFYSGQTLEHEKMKLKFESVLQSARRVIKTQAILDFLGNFYDRGTGSLFVIWTGKCPPLLCSFVHMNSIPFCRSPALYHCSGCVCYLLINTSNSPADQSNTSDSFLAFYVLLAGSFGSLAAVFGMFGPLSAAFGCGARVLYLKQLLEGAELAAEAGAAMHSPGSALDSLVLPASDASVQLSNICVRVPHSEQELVSGLTLSVPGNALLMGPSGCGKRGCMGWGFA
jgi:ABC-type uncharacterized transport system fused permease/ATPase subunit